VEGPGAGAVEGNGAGVGDIAADGALAIAGHGDGARCGDGRGNGDGPSAREVHATHAADGALEGQVAQESLLGILRVYIGECVEVQAVGDVDRHVDGEGTGSVVGLLGVGAGKAGGDDGAACAVVENERPAPNRERDHAVAVDL